MTHDEAYERLASLVGLRAADTEDGALRAHVDGCEACQERLKVLREVDGALRDPNKSVGPCMRHIDLDKVSTIGTLCSCNCR